MGIICKGFDPLDIYIGGVFDPETAAESHDNHLEPYIGALVDGFLHRFIFSAAYMHQDRIFGKPGRDGSPRFSQCQPFAFPVPVVVDKFPYPVTLKIFSGFNNHVGTIFGFYHQEAGIPPVIVDLCQIKRIFCPLIRFSVFFSSTGKVCVYRNVWQHPGALLKLVVARFYGSKNFTGKAVEADWHTAVVP